MSSEVERLETVLKFVQAQIIAAKATSTQPVGKSVPTNVALGNEGQTRIPKTEVTEADKAIFSHISSKIGTLQGTFGMFHDNEMTRETALAQGKRLLNDVMMALVANPQTIFDQIRVLISDVDLAREIDINRGQGDLLQKAKTKADDNLSNVVEGDLADVEKGDITGDVGGG